jgi:hypothetical protein
MLKLFYRLLVFKEIFRKVLIRKGENKVIGAGLLDIILAEMDLR